MIIIKKLVFAPLFLIIFAILIYQLTPFLKSYDLIFLLNLGSLTQLIIVALFFTACAITFVIFASLAQNWKITLPIAAVGAIFPLMFIDISLGMIFAIGIFLSCILTAVLLNSALASYLNFQPGKVLGPSVKLLSMLLILSFCAVYFLAVNKIIAQTGFQIPDSLIDTALKMSPAPQEVALPNTLIKQAVKDQLQNLIQPYQNFVPLVLAILLFFMMQFFTSIINIFISPFLLLVFFILEKTGFVGFEIEKREVRKLVV